MCSFSRPSARRLGFLLVSYFAVAGGAHAQFKETGAGPYDYNNAAFWTGGNIDGTFPQGPVNGNQQIDFSSAPATPPTFNFTFSGTTPSLTFSAAGPLTISLGGDIMMTSPSAGAVVNFSAGVDLALGASRTFSIASGNTLNIAGAISGETFALTKGGAGTLILTGSNSYTAGTVVTGGVLQIGDSANGLDGSVAGESGTGIAISSGANVTFSPNVNSRYSGLISGAGSLTKIGTAVMELDGPNTYTGVTTVSAGTLKISGSGTRLASPAAIAAAGTLTFYVAEDPQSYSGNISGSGTFAKDGGATLNFSGTGTGFTGATSILAGCLQIDAVNALGTASAVTVANIGTFNLQFDQEIASLTGGGANSSVVIATTRVLKVSGSGSTAFDGVISGAGSVSRSGTGTLTLSGANAYTGTTTISGGKLADAAAGAFSAASAVNMTGGVLEVNHNETIPGLGGTGGSTTIANGATLTINNTSAASYSYAGAISGSGALTKADTGSLSLTGANTHTGGTTITGGTLTIGDGTTTGTVSGDIVNNASLVFNRSDANMYAGNVSGTGNLNKFGTGTLTLTGSSSYTGSTVLSSGTLNLGSVNAIGSSGTIHFIAGTLQFSTANTTDYSARFSNAGSQAFKIDTNGKTVTFASALSSTGGTLTKTGTGTLILTGTNTYTGSTTVDSGVLRIVADTGLGGAPGTATPNSLNITSGAALETNGTFTLNANRGINVGGSGGSIYTWGGTTLTYGGAIAGSTFTKDGSGTLILTGVNTQTGGTILREGTLIITNESSLGGTAAALTFNGGTLQPTGALTLVRSVTLQSGAGGIVKTNGFDLTMQGAISGAGYLIKSGTGALNLTGVNSYSGKTTIEGGSLVASAANVLSPNSRLSINGGTAVTVSADNTAAGLEDYNSGSPGTISTTAKLTLNVPASQFTAFKGTLTGSGSLVKDGLGTQTVYNLQHTGGTTVNAGVLQFGGFDTVTAVTGNITNNGTVAFATSNALTYADVISGGGGANFAGSAGTTLTGANSYTGGTTIANSGKLILAHVGGGTLSSSGDVTLQSSATFQVNTNQTIRGLIGTSQFSSVIIGTGATLTTNLPASGTGSTATYAGNISGTGSYGFTKDGPGTMIFTGSANLDFANTTLSVAVNGGTLQVGEGSISGLIAGNIGIASGAKLVLSRSDAQTYPFAVSGSGTFEKSGTGNLTLTGANTFTGTALINAGTLTVGADNAEGANSVTVASGANFAVNFNTAIGSLSGLGNTTVAAGKTLTLKNVGGLSAPVSGAGSVTFNNGGLSSGVSSIGANQTYTGLTSVLFGTLNIGQGGTAGSVAGDILLGSGTSVFFNRNDSLSYAKVVSGSGNLSKNGTGTLTLAGANTYTGNTVVSNGTLKIAAVNALPTTTGVSVGGGATLNIAANQTIKSFGNSFATSSIVLEASQILNVALGTSTTGTVFNGSLSGAGGFQVGTNFGAHTVTLTSDNTYTGGTTIDSGGALRLGDNTPGGMIVGDVVDNGILIFQRTSAATFSGIVSGTGIVQHGTIGGTATLGDTKLTGANTYSGGTQVYLGKLFASNISGSATGTGAVTVQYNGTFGGTGSISGPLNVNAGGMVAPISDGAIPGTLKVGATTFAGGGKFGFGISNANGTGGTDFSLLSISGALSIGATSSDPFTVALYSFASAGTLGALPNFDSAQTYSWVFAQASGGISGFNAAGFNVDTTNFGSTFPGTFSVGLSGNTLLLQYSPVAVPEPSTWALLGVGLAIVVVVVGMRERRQAPRLG